MTESDVVDSLGELIDEYLKDRAPAERVEPLRSLKDQIEGELLIRIDELLAKL